MLYLKGFLCYKKWYKSMIYPNLDSKRVCEGVSKVVLC